MKFIKEFISNSPEETKQPATKIASQLKGGEVIGLVGELGTGKTVFVQGLAEGLGVNEIVNSPTFILMKVFEIRNSKFGIRNLIHVDAYRINNSQELKDIGVEEYLGKDDNIVVIEWAEKVKDLLPENSMMIEFKEGDSENQRVMRIIE